MRKRRTKALKRGKLLLEHTCSPSGKRIYVYSNPPLMVIFKEVTKGKYTYRIEIVPLREKEDNPIGLNYAIDAVRDELEEFVLFCDDLFDLDLKKDAMIVRKGKLELYLKNAEKLLDNGFKVV